MLFLRTGHPPRLLKRMLTAAEACELRMFYARYPFDDESNHWLPHGMLMANLHAMTAGKDTEQKAAIDFMPFAKREREVEETFPTEKPVGTKVEMTKKQMKRIQQSLARKRK